MVCLHVQKKQVQIAVLSRQLHVLTWSNFKIFGPVCLPYCCTFIPDNDKGGGLIDERMAMCYEHDEKCH